MNVLIVDDDAGTRALLARVLTQGLRDITVLHADDGLKALDQVLAEGVDVVLLDLAMRGMSGLDTLEAIRRSPAHNALPVIVMSGQADQAHVVRALELGITTFLAKPFTPSSLSQRLFPALSDIEAAVRAAKVSLAPLELKHASRVVIVDRQAEFRSFFCDRVSPTCIVDEAPDEMAALARCCAEPAEAVFVGATDAPFDVPGFREKVHKATGNTRTRVIAVAPPTDLESVRAEGVYGEVVARSFVPDVFDRSLREIVSEATRARLLFSAASPAVAALFDCAASVLEESSGDAVTLEDVQSFPETAAKSLWAGVEVQSAQLAWEIRLRCPLAAALELSAASLTLEIDQVSDARMTEMGMALASRLGAALRDRVVQEGLDATACPPRVTLALGESLWPYDPDKAGVGRWLITPRHSPALVLQLVSL